MKRPSNFLRDPLVHFIALGVLLFVGHMFWEKHYGAADNHIIITKADINRLGAQFQGETSRVPTQTDIEGLLLAHIEEEALVREAFKLGLDTDDAIIRRRLAQKMRFILQEGQAGELPSDDVLEDWYEANKDLFKQHERRSLSHIYFGDAGFQSLDNPAALLAEISDANWMSYGEAFIEGRAFKLQSPDYVAVKFGKDFAKAAFNIGEQGQWSGPIQSALGWHFVRIDDIEAGQTPKFETIKSSVKEAWLEQNRKDINRKKLDDLLDQYKVTIARPSE